MGAWMLNATAQMQLSGIIFNENIRELCHMQVIGLNEGPAGLVGSYQEDGCTFCDFEIPFSVYSIISAPMTHYLIFYFHHVTSGSWCMGRCLHPYAALVIPPGITCELMLGVDARITAIVAPIEVGMMDLLDRCIQPNEAADLLVALLPLEQHDCTPLQMVYRASFSVLLNERHTTSSELWSRDWQDLTLEQDCRSACLITHALDQPDPFGYFSYYPAFRKAVHFMRENLCRDIYISDVASAIRTSERNLTLLFRRMIGMSPGKYLLLYRLHEAAHQCSKRGARRSLVKSIALSCGYWHLSRFSAHYKRIHGEYPSETLARIEVTF